MSSLYYDEHGNRTCPLCITPLDSIDLSTSCNCGYQICGFCRKRISEGPHPLCPACRHPLEENLITVSSSQSTEPFKTVQREPPRPPKPLPQKIPPNLGQMRVVTKNLVYLVGLPCFIANENILFKFEYLGQYGALKKIMVNISRIVDTPVGPTVSAYLTFETQHAAALTVYALDGLDFEGYNLKASFGTTKYCSFFLRGLPCSAPSCLYLHSIAPQDVSFKKEEMNHTPNSPFYNAIRPTFDSIFTQIPQDSQITPIPNFEKLTSWPSVFPPPYTLGRDIRASGTVPDEITDWPIHDDIVEYLARHPQSLHLTEGNPEFTSTPVIDAEQTVLQPPNEDISNVTVEEEEHAEEREEEECTSDSWCSSKPAQDSLFASIDSDLFDFSSSLSCVQDTTPLDSSDAGLSLLKSTEEPDSPISATTTQLHFGSWMGPPGLMDSFTIEPEREERQMVDQCEEFTSFGPHPLNLRSKNDQPMKLDLFSALQTDFKPPELPTSVPTVDDIERPKRLEDLDESQKTTVLMPTSESSREPKKKNNNKSKNKSKKVKNNQRQSKEKKLLETEISKLNNRFQDLTQFLKDKDSEEVQQILDLLNLPPLVGNDGIGSLSDLSPPHSFANSNVLAGFPKVMKDLFPLDQ
ncbi:hypothetical protein P9112_000828 [Eukaryota sp. TZLM1-RC]